MIIRKKIQCMGGESKDDTRRGGTSHVVQLSSVAQSCLTLCDPMDRSTPGFPVHHQLLEFIQTHGHRVSDAFCSPTLFFSPRPIPQRGKLSPDGLSDSFMSFGLWAPNLALLGDFLMAPAGLSVGCGRGWGVEGDRSSFIWS